MSKQCEVQHSTEKRGYLEWAKGGGDRGFVCMLYEGKTRQIYIRKRDLMSLAQALKTTLRQIHTNFSSSPYIQVV